MNHTVLSLKKSGLRKYWKLQWSCQPYRTASISLLVVWVFYNLQKTRLVACRYGLAFISVLAKARRILEKFSEMWCRSLPKVDEALRRMRMTQWACLWLLARLVPQYVWSRQFEWRIDSVYGTFVTQNRTNTVRQLVRIHLLHIKELFSEVHWNNHPVRFRS